MTFQKLHKEILEYGQKPNEVTAALSASFDQNDAKYNENFRKLHEQPQEGKDRLRRASNILIMRLPENESVLRLAHEMRKILLPTIITVTILEQRVGIQKPNSTRPLSIHLLE
jgi:hypothetical protein